MELSEQGRQALRRIVARYPNTQAACLPALHLAQQEAGWISDEAIEMVARELGLPPAHVYGVATFYTMFDKQPVGRFHVQVCTNVACMLRGGYDVLRAIERRLGVRPGETTADGRFTLSEVECLAACTTAVCVQVNGRYHENLDTAAAERLIDSLRKEAAG